VESIPLGVAVMAAQVPVVYQVPALMMHPFCVPPLTTFRMPFPDSVPGLAVEVEVGVAVVPVEGAEGVGPPGFGKYLIPEEGQVEPDPTGLAGLKVPL
jgi:hypothetical protein